MEEILKIDTVDQYNKLFGFETRQSASFRSIRPRARETTG